MESSGPVLPLELERMIFLLVVDNTGDDDAMNLLAVARRVREWVMKPLITTVIFHPMRTYPNFILPSHLEEYGQYVRHLCFTTWFSPSETTPSPSQIFTLCPNIESLALWGGVYQNETITSLYLLPLKRLSIPLSRLPHPSVLTSQMISFLSGITHLDLGNTITRWSECRILLHFAGLTHLAIAHSSDIEVLKMILQRMRGLKVLIFLSANTFSKGKVQEANMDMGLNELRDIRLVGLSSPYLSDWEDGARGREDMWVFAENIIRARLRNRMA